MDIKQKIEKANEEVAQRLIQGEPVLVDIAPAGEVIPGLQETHGATFRSTDRMERMCGAQHGAVIGMVLFEGWAKTAEEAQSMLQKGEIRWSQTITIKLWDQWRGRSPLQRRCGWLKIKPLEIGLSAAG